MIIIYDVLELFLCKYHQDYDEIFSALVKNEKDENQLTIVLQYLLDKQLIHHLVNDESTSEPIYASGTYVIEPEGFNFITNYHINKEASTTATRISKAALLISFGSFIIALLSQFSEISPLINRFLLHFLQR